MMLFTEVWHLLLNRACELEKMVQVSISLLAFAGTCAATVLPNTCPIQFEGRVPRGGQPAFFDADTSLFNPGYVKGSGKGTLRRQIVLC